MDAYEFARLLHENRLRRAEKQRLYRQFARLSPSWRVRVGDLLIAFGDRLKTDAAYLAQPHPPANGLDL